jgi:O-acetyl-ADP-ribose deacetylase (regulator of RNase III)
MNMHVGKGIVTVVQGDIADQDTEVIVNAANNHLWMGAGVAGAIKRKGGSVIETEAMALGPIPVGGAVLTSAGSLKAKGVIHAAVMGQDLHTSAEAISKASVSSLTLAEQRGFTSLSFPAFGTGVGGFSLPHCASLMMSAAVEFLVVATRLREVRFVLFDEEARAIFEHELRNRFSAHPH